MEPCFGNRAFDNLPDQSLGNFIPKNFEAADSHSQIRRIRIEIDVFRRR
jgi:hypothetical protein